MRVSRPETVATILLMSVFVMLQFSCMKHSCYECKDEFGRVVKGGCDKTRDEVKEYAESTGQRCVILPD